jgi:hypothetical protein
MHYARLRRHGDPGATPRFDADPTERFWANVEVGHPAGCWWWRGKINNNGYGILPVGRRTLGEARTVMAHRFAYEDLVALIPDGMVIDHLCKNRRCVNPDHVEVVTPGMNVRRGWPARSPFCRHGLHRMTPENTYIQPSSGRRVCVACKTAAISAWNERMKAAS